MRRSLHSELLRLVGVERSVWQHQLLQTGLAREVDWDKVLSTKTKITAVLPQPATWIDNNWGYVVKNARENAKNITFLVPDPKAGYFSEFCATQNRDEATLAMSIQEFIDQVEEKWKRAADASALDPESSLRVLLLSNPPAYLAVSADTEVVIQLDGPLGVDDRFPPLHLRFAGGEDSYPRSAVANQIDDASLGGVIYENKVRK